MVADDTRVRYPFQDQNVADVTVGTTDTVVYGDTKVGRSGSAGVVNGVVKWLWFALFNRAAGQTISSCKVQIKLHPDDDWHDYILDADFDATDNVNMKFASTTGPHEITSGDSAVACVHILGVYAYRILCAVASSTTDVAVMVSESVES